MAKLLVALTCLAAGEETQTAFWEQVHAQGSIPQQRHSHVAVWDDAVGMVIHGGKQGSNKSDTWRYTPSSNSWQRLQDGPARAGHAAAYGDGNLYIYGCSHDSPLYSFDGSEWINQTTAGMPNLCGAAAVWNPLSAKMLIFFGRLYYESPEFSYDYLNGMIYAYHPSSGSFSEIYSISHPAPYNRWKFSAVWNPDREVVWIYGGHGQGAGTFYDDAWEYDPAAPDGGSWLNITTLSGRAQGRGGHAAAYDTLTGQMLVFGGTVSNGDGGTLQDSSLWVFYVVETDTEIQSYMSYVFAPPEPSGRGHHTGVFDDVNGHFLVFGGRDSNSQPLSELHRFYQLAEATETSTSATSATVTVSSTSKTSVTGSSTTSSSTEVSFTNTTTSTATSTTTATSEFSATATATVTSTLTGETATVTETTSASWQNSTSTTGTTQLVLPRLTSTTQSSTATSLSSTSSSATSSSSTTASTTSSSSTSSSSSSTTASTTSSSSTSSSSTSTSSSSTSTSSSSSTSLSSTSSTSSTTSSAITTTSSTLSSLTSSSTLTTSSTMSTSTSLSSTSSSTTSTASSSTRSSSTTSSTTTTSSLHEVVLVPLEMQGSVQGQLVEETLQAVLDTLGNSSQQIVSIASGEVTVVSLNTPSTPTSTWTTLEVARSTEALTVLLPNEVIDGMGGNQKLLVTELLPEVTQQLPQSGTVGSAGGAGVLTGAVVEISLASEAAGTVQLTNVSGLSTPVLFRIRNGVEPIDLDVCVFWDPVLQEWSQEGLQLVRAGDVEGVDVAAGTWCMTTHLSLFAIMQTIPFGSQWPDGPQAAEAAGTVVVISMIVCGIGSVVVSILLRRRLRTPHKGEAHVKASKGTQKFEFTRTMTAASSSTSKGRKGRNGRKVLVQWHLKLDSVVKQIDTFDGLRHVSVDLDAGWKPVMQEPSLQSAKSFRTLPDSVEDDVEWSKEPEEQAPDATIMELLARVAQPSAIEKGDQEAYADGEVVLYHSETYGRVVPASIVGGGLFHDAGELEAWPVYNCKVGMRLREMVPLRRLRACPQEGTLVKLQAGGEGRILAAAAWGMTHLTKYPSYEVMLADGKVSEVAFDQLQRCFLQQQLVEVYMGRLFGWVYGTVAHDAVEPSAAAADASVDVEVTLLRDELAVTVPSFLVRCQPALSARI